VTRRRLISPDPGLSARFTGLLAPLSGSRVNAADNPAHGGRSTRCFPRTRRKRRAYNRFRGKGRKRPCNARRGLGFEPLVCCADVARRTAFPGRLVGLQTPTCSEDRIFHPQRWLLTPAGGTTHNQAIALHTGGNGTLSFRSCFKDAWRAPGVSPGAGKPGG